MQTDPIGYEDQMNLYAYVGNDPVNATDPTGMSIEGGCVDNVDPSSPACIPSLSSSGGSSGASPQPAPSQPSGPNSSPAANDNRPPAANDNNPRGNGFFRGLGRIAGLLGIASALENLNNDKDVLYRGLSGSDIQNLMTSGAIMPNDINGNLTAEKHALDSTGSQFISFTTDKSVAIHFANSGPDPTGYVASISLQSAAYSGRLIIPNVATFSNADAKANVISESEVLILGPVPVTALRSIEKVGGR